MCLASSRRERTERGVYAASTWDNPCDLSEVPERQEVRTVKRPEGRAPAPIFVGTLNTCLPQGGREQNSFSRLVVVSGALHNVERLFPLAASLPFLHSDAQWPSDRFQH